MKRFLLGFVLGCVCTAIPAVRFISKQADEVYRASMAKTSCDYALATTKIDLDSANGQLATANDAVHKCFAMADKNLRRFDARTQKIFERWRQQMNEEHAAKQHIFDDWQRSLDDSHRNLKNIERALSH